MGAHRLSARLGPACARRRGRRRPGHQQRVDRPRRPGHLWAGLTGDGNSYWPQGLPGPPASPPNRLVGHPAPRAPCAGVRGPHTAQPPTARRGCAAGSDCRLGAERCHFCAEPEKSRCDPFRPLSPPRQPGVLVQEGSASKGGSQAQPRHEDSCLESHPDTRWPPRAEAGAVTAPSPTSPSPRAAQLGWARPATSSALPPGPCARRRGCPHLCQGHPVSHRVTPDKPLGPSEPRLPYLPSGVYTVGEGSPRVSGGPRATARSSTRGHSPPVRAFLPPFPSAS